MKENIRDRAVALKQKLQEDYSSVAFDTMDEVYKAIERVDSALDNAIVKADGANQSNIPNPSKNYEPALRRLRVAKAEIRKAMGELVPDIGAWGPYKDANY